MDLIPNRNRASPVVLLDLMPQQVEARSLDEDWTGVTSTAERLKRQNRLHQRAYRRRQRDQQARLSNQQHYHNYVDNATSNPLDPIRTLEEGTEETETKVSRELPEGYLLLATSRSRAEAERFTQSARQSYAQGMPRLEHLPVVIRFNVLAAIACNATMLRFNFEGLCSPTLVSPFNHQGPDFPCMRPSPQSCPDVLQPTPLQAAVRHHPWIDLIPLPGMRDNILRALATGHLDHGALGRDVLDVEDLRDEAACLIVWGEPWDPMSWEATIPFLRKWGWLMQGCSTMLEATNSWREKRGEKKIAFHLASIPHEENP